MAVKPGNSSGGNGERDPRLDALYRDAPRDTPPAHLDAAILAAARREVGSRPRSLYAQLRRWRLPVSIAAVVVLSVTLVTLIGEENRDPLMTELRYTAKLPVARTEKPPEQPADPGKAPESGERFAVAPEARKRAAAAPEELILRHDEVAAMVAADARYARERDLARSSAEPAPRAKAPAGPAPAAAAPPAAVGGDVSQLSQLLGSRALAEADDAAQKSSSATIGIRGTSGETEQPATAPQSKPMAEKPAHVEDRGRPLAKRAPAWRGLEQEPPQKWLERLAELTKQGRTGEADELLAEFKRRFPSHPLPKGQE